MSNSGSGNSSSGVMTSALAKPKYLVSASIVLKQLAGLSGLVWTLFVLTHMGGNMLIFVGAEAYNRYGHALVTNPLIYVAEVVLVVFLLTHSFLAVALTLKNKRARPVNYAVNPSHSKAATLAQKTMIFHGSLLLVFIVFHLITFKFGTHYSVVYNGIEMRDLHRLVVEVFREPLYVVGYIVCLIGLGFHLSHGVSSSFQTFGINHPSYNGAIKKFGVFYALIVTLGFIAQPLYVFFFYQAK